MHSQFARTELLVGSAAMERLWNARVAVFGIGGVGGYAVEALARSGIGTLDLFDHDTVSLTNLNRQILATHDTVGMLKVEAAKARIHAICPDITVNAHPVFYLPETAGEFDFTKYDYIIDAIDTVTAKLHMAQEAKNRGIKLLMCLGTGNRLDPEKLRIGDISETAGCVCGLAKVMRREIRKRGIGKQTVLFSTEEAKKCAIDSENGRHAPGSISFVPPAAGYLLASKCVRDILSL